MKGKLLIFYLPIRQGGLEHFLVEVSLQFRKQYSETIVINLSKSLDFEEALRERGVAFLTLSDYVLSLTPTKGVLVKHLLRLMPTLLNRRLRKEYENTDLLWAHGFPANLYIFALKIFSRDTGKKFIYTHHSIKKEMAAFPRLIYLWVLSSFDTIVGVSHKVCYSLEKCFPELKTKIIDIPNGIDLRLFAQSNKQESLRAELNLPPVTVLAIYAARFDPLKNHMLLIEVLKRLRAKNMKLILLGDGSERTAFLAKAKEEGVVDMIISRGFVHNAVVPHYLMASDLCLFPSLLEGFGIAVIEAMAASLPVVIMKDIYINEFGNHILTAQTPEEFVADAERLVDSAGYRKALSEKMFLDAKQFDLPGVIDKYIDVFGELLR